MTNSTTQNNGSNQNTSNNDWITHIFVFGIAAGVLLIFTALAIARSRFKSIRKAKKKYRKYMLRTREELANVRRATLIRDRERKLGRSNTFKSTLGSQDAFHIQTQSPRAIGFDNNIIEEDAFESDSGDGFEPPEKSIYVKAIAPFTQGFDASSITHEREMYNDTPPPPRLSPSFQSSLERVESPTPSLTKSIPLYPYPETADAFIQDGFPPLMPREPVNPMWPSNESLQQTPTQSPRQRAATRQNSRSPCEDTFDENRYNRRSPSQALRKKGIGHQRGTPPTSGQQTPPPIISRSSSPSIMINSREQAPLAIIPRSPSLSDARLAKKSALDYTQLHDYTKITPRSSSPSILNSKEQSIPAIIPRSPSILDTTEESSEESSLDYNQSRNHAKISSRLSSPSFPRKQSPPAIKQRSPSLSDARLAEKFSQDYTQSRNLTMNSPRSSPPSLPNSEDQSTPAIIPTSLSDARLTENSSNHTKTSPRSLSFSILHSTERFPPAVLPKPRSSSMTKSTEQPAVLPKPRSSSMTKSTEQPAVLPKTRSLSMTKSTEQPFPDYAQSRNDTKILSRSSSPSIQESPERFLPAISSRLSSVLNVRPIEQPPPDYAQLRNDTKISSRLSSPSIQESIEGLHQRISPRLPSVLRSTEQPPPDYAQSRNDTKISPRSSSPSVQESMEGSHQRINPRLPSVLRSTEQPPPDYAQSRNDTKISPRPLSPSIQESMAGSHRRMSPRLPSVLRSTEQPPPDYTQSGIDIKISPRLLSHSIPESTEPRLPDIPRSPSLSTMRPKRKSHHYYTESRNQIPRTRSCSIPESPKQLHSNSVIKEPITNSIEQSPIERKPRSQSYSMPMPDYG